MPAGSTLETDVCIAGGGPAGITLAVELAESGLDVVLLESGGLEDDPRTHALTGGESVGYPYMALERSRMRYFGGTSNHWEWYGWRARPLEIDDFEAKEWVPQSDWPFGREELEPYYDRAHVIAGLGPNSYEVEEWQQHGAIWRRLQAHWAWAEALSGEDVVPMLYQWGAKDSFARYSGELSTAEHVRVAFHANLVRIRSEARDDKVSAFEVATLDGNRFSVRARRYVLAMGGIENARHLLLSTERHPKGLGNEHDLVGRYFVDHPLFTPAYVRDVEPDLIEALAGGSPIATSLEIQIGLSRERVQGEQLLGASFMTYPAHSIRMATAVNSVRELRMVRSRHPRPHALGTHARTALRGLPDIARFIRQRASGRFGDPDVLVLEGAAELAPDPESRVTLGSKRDALGLPVPRLRWGVSERDLASLARTTRLVGERIEALGVGLLVPMIEDRSSPQTATQANHQIGVTRMHRDPSHGVVDENCRVHSVGNLYVAGSSIFPTAGYTTPTLTIAALSIRLADHLRAELGTSAEG